MRYDKRIEVENDAPELSKRIADLCNSFLWTQGDLADESGLSPGTISALLFGNKKDSVRMYTDPRSETIKCIAEALNTSTDYLLGRTETKSTNPTVQSAVEYTGLSESAAEKLHRAIADNPYMALVISFLIDSFAAAVEENQIPAIYRNLSFAIWENFIAYPVEKRYNVIDDSTFYRRDIDVIGEHSKQRTSIDTNVFPAAVFQQLSAYLDKLRDKEQSENHSEYREKFIETVKRYEGGVNNG